MNAASPRTHQASRTPDEIQLANSDSELYFDSRVSTSRVLQAEFMRELKAKR